MCEIHILGALSRRPAHSKQVTHGHKSMCPDEHAPCAEKTVGGQLRNDAVMFEGRSRASKDLRRLRHRCKLPGRFYVVEALHQGFDPFVVWPNISHALLAIDIPVAEVHITATMYGARMERTLDTGQSLEFERARLLHQFRVSGLGGKRKFFE